MWRHAANTKVILVLWAVHIINQRHCKAVKNHQGLFSIAQRVSMIYETLPSRCL
jgi:hypothetical protein